MRLHSLSMTAFGPFKGTETIDFGKLSEAKLFLVAGPTGSGKTTILDAICYALYGETTGEGQGTGAVDGRSGAELRSRDAALGTPTEVQLVFEVAGTVYRVVRRPMQFGLGRGGVKREDKPTAKLFKCTHAGAPAEQDEPVASQIREVKTAVEELLGFTAEQFRRVVLIPQGRFRDVLVSEAGKREELLKRIFRTDCYERFEEIVKARAVAASKSKSDLDGERTRLVAEEAWASGCDGTMVQQELVERSRAAEAEATARSDAHVKAQAERDAAVKTFAAAELVSKLFASLVHAREALKAAETAFEQHKDQRGELADAQRASESMKCLQALRNRRKALQDAEQALAAAKTRLGTCETQCKETDAARTRAEADAKNLPAMRERLGALRAEINTINQDQKRRADAEADIEAKRTVVKKREDALAAIEGRLKEASERRDAANDKLQRMEQRFAEGAAGRLSKLLAPNAACPVCGSCEHPRPAVLPAEIPTEEAVEACRQAMDVANASHETVRRERDDAREKLANEKGLLEQAETALAELPAVADKASLEDEISKLEAREQEIDQLKRTAEEAYGQALSALQAAKVALATAEEALRTAKGELDDAQRRFDDAVRAASIGTEEEVESLARTDERIKELDEKLEQVDKALDAAKVKVSSLEEQVAGKDHVELEPLREAQARAIAADREAEQAKASAAAERLRLSDLVARHGKVLERAGDADRQLEVIGALNEVIQGKGGMSLHRWVLASVLEEVLAEATMVLREISSDQYHLFHAERSADGRVRDGLDIEVFDTNSDSRRPARTLSGGETFLASLALALALARTTERRGGRRIDTMFIDEGFGSLDADRLDQALTALRRLSNEGRVVGVISHVDEMQRAIAAKLEVVPSRSGSSTRLVGLE